ncbi:MAG: dynamin family protein [Phycisphaerae bacterium]|jgi:GTP-binding protein EngB required for normal cell division
MNAFHRQHVASTFRTIDQRLTEIEAILLAVGAESPLSTYVMDVGPMERQATAGYIKRIREKMWWVTKQLEVHDDRRRTSAAWALRTALLGAMIDLVDLEPHRMRGYGEVNPESAPKLAAACADLQRLFNSLDAYLRRSQGEDLGKRLARLETAPATRDALATIEAVITRNGLVELRPRLDMILSRLEAPEYEVAFFGRVSSGKSSLLNYLLGSDILPVAVLPVTAVITRLRRAERAGLLVRFEVSQPAAVPVDQIAQFVTEEGNSDNRRRVAEVEVHLPSPRLQHGVTLIDTPGVGSLATFGAAQTKAYLPRCDLGVLLVDAGASLNQEDLAILQGFHDAAVPAMVLVSKCDLLSGPDRARVVSYVEQHIREALGCELPVHPVSTRGADAALTDCWFDERIVPLMRDHRASLERSLRRKIGNLCDTVAAFLTARLDRAAGSAVFHSAIDQATIRRLMEAAGDRIAAVSLKLTEPTDKGMNDTLSEIMDQTAAHVVEQTRRGNGGEGVLRERLLGAMVHEAETTRAQIEELGRFLAETIERLALTLEDMSRVADDPPHESGAMAELRTPPGPLPQPAESRLSDLSPVRCPWLLSLLPGLARSVVRRRIRRANWGQWSALSDYRTKLRTWLTVELRRLTEAYESQAALIHERLAAAGREGASPPVATDAVREDLERMQALLSPVSRDSDAVRETLRCETTLDPVT